MKFASLYSTVAAVVVASIAHGDVCHLDKVDPFIGTGGNGHTTPAAAYPFGMVQPGPDTGHEGWERCSGYQYGDKAIQRFSQNHLSGTGCSEFGDLGFMPSADNPEEALKRELHALAGKANRDGQFYEIYHPETGEAYGGLQEKWDGKKLVIGDWMSCTHQTWSATAYLSLIYYHVLGADICEGEVVFKPYLPSGVNEIAVRDFKVGETTFDIVVVRGGNGPKEATCRTTEKKRVKLFLSVEE